MRQKQRSLRRRQLDSLRSQMRPDEHAVRPPKGWIRTIRQALGMSLESLGSRLDMTRQAALSLERAEANDAITVKRLRAAADALNCDLVVYLHPREPLEAMVQRRAMEVARDIVSRTGHSMALEGQGIPREQLEDMIEETARNLIVREDKRLWDEDAGS